MIGVGVTDEDALFVVVPLADVSQFCSKLASLSL